MSCLTVLPEYQWGESEWIRSKSCKPSQSTFFYVKWKVRNIYLQTKNQREYEWQEKKRGLGKITRILLQKRNFQVITIHENISFQSLSRWAEVGPHGGSTVTIVAAECRNVDQVYLRTDFQWVVMLNYGQTVKTLNTTFHFWDSKFVIDRTVGEAQSSRESKLRFKKGVLSTSTVIVEETTLLLERRLWSLFFCCRWTFSAFSLITQVFFFEYWESSYSANRIISQVQALLVIDSKFVTWCHEK